MATYESSTDIQASTERVWAVLSDVETWSRWMPTVSSVEPLREAPLQVGRVDVFIPVVQSIICVTELITAVFLFAQYSIQPQRALLALAGGYICSGLFAFLQTLEFPGAYSATGLLGGGRSGAAWLFNFWRITFALAVITYALLKDASDTGSHAY